MVTDGGQRVITNATIIYLIHRGDIVPKRSYDMETFWEKYDDMTRKKNKTRTMPDRKRKSKYHNHRNFQYIRDNIVPYMELAKTQKSSKKRK